MIYSLNIPRANVVVLSYCFNLIFNGDSIGDIDLKS